MKNRLFKTLCHLLQQTAMKEEEIKQFVIDIASQGIGQLKSTIWQIRKEGY